jgi:hypothetical protein
MAENYTDVWTTDGTGCFTVLGTYEAIRKQLTHELAGDWIELVRVVWQDPDREGGVDEAWPAYAELPLALRISEVTGISAASAGMADSVHRARAHSLQ